MSELKWFILLFVLMWMAWYYTGGPERAADKYNPFVEQPLAPGDDKDIYNVGDLRRSR